ncbi:uncharacterized protein BXZ73DRAFT_30508, partial [Epithele typhae]|uniref:uncharacterized protein n=1 Tax=Epithele typhae TaxID=378194 RepID=UPI0020087C0D
GHVGIEGNELADKHAKRAAEGDSSCDARLPALFRKPLPVSLAASRRAHLDVIKSRAAETWKTSTRGKRLARIDPDLPSPTFIK